MSETTVRQLWGREFDIIAEGLAESQVVAFVTELISERDQLIERQDHLLSLTKLAERTIAEADKLASDLKMQAEEESKTVAAAILAKAEQEAQEVMEQKRAEILAAANSEAETIKDNARREVEASMNQYKQQVQTEIKERVQKLHEQVISGLEGVTEQAIALQTEWESKLSEPIIDSQPPDDGELPVSVPVASGQREETAPATTAEEDSEHNNGVPEQFHKAWSDADTDAADSQQQPPTTSTEKAHQTETKKMSSATAVSDKEETTVTSEGMVELDILPPVNPSQLVDIQRYIQDWPGIGITELRPHNGGYSIIVMLDKPLQLISILKQLPEIQNATVCSADKADTPDGTTPGKDNLKRIEITVGKA